MFETGFEKGAAGSDPCFTVYKDEARFPPKILCLPTKVNGFASHDRVRLTFTVLRV
jgi:hypothetical protein